MQHCSGRNLRDTSAQEASHGWRLVRISSSHHIFAKVGRRPSLELPEVYGDGNSADESVEQVREALTAVIAYMIESGQTPPAPADEQLRDKQVNIRLTEAEQRRLRAAARARG